MSPLLLDDEMAGYEEPKRTFIRHLVDGEKGLVTLAVEPYPTDDSLSTLAKLQNYLAEKKFIVVLDDIQRKEHWDGIKIAFPNAFLGCRIVVTTTCSTVASVCASSSDHVCRLNGFEWSEGWKLLRRKAFPDNSGECPSELKDSSDKIDKKCEIRRGSELSVIGNPLLPGYMDLSSNLKSCFLYFSIFPEDYSVNCGRLIRLWDLVHVSNWDFDGRPRSCRVLNLAFQFIIQKCKDENFASIVRRANTSQSQKIGVSITTNAPFVQNSDFHGVRSMFLWGAFIESSLPDLRDLRKSKLQRVLDLQEAPLTEISEDITSLTLLRASERNILSAQPPSLFAYKKNDLSLVMVDAKGRILKHLKELSQLRKLGLTGLLSEHGEALSASIEQMKNIRTLDLCSASKAEYLEVTKMTNPPHTLQRLYLKGLLRELPSGSPHLITCSGLV
ncbi:putative disease resistance RPP13-like protein 2 [Sesamum angolense]|uniref:Disease resistance RPP13-like protein 2 n=1 Tax=Sesamum angolense TaxID=2727404 RepID=A0AAE1WS94_9LAMI|nr:putative disease resistance RPP13-like protein 2 [Sesamum angolense]